MLGFGQRLRWYHGVAFVLIGLIFLPVGMGVAAILERPHMLLGVTVIFTMLRGSWLITRLAPAALGFLPVLALFLTLPAMGMVADSEDPQRHLLTALIVTAIIEIGFFVLPDNRPEAGAPAERAILPGRRRLGALVAAPLPH